MSWMVSAQKKQNTRIKVHIQPLNIPSNKEFQWEMHKHTEWSSLYSIAKLACSFFVLTLTRLHAHSTHRFSFLIEPKMWESAYGLVENIRRLQFHSTKNNRKNKKKRREQTLHWVLWSNILETHGMSYFKFKLKCTTTRTYRLYHIIYKILYSRCENRYEFYILKFVEMLSALQRHRKNVELKMCILFEIVCTFGKNVRWMNLNGERERGQR